MFIVPPTIRRRVAVLTALLAPGWLLGQPGAEGKPVRVRVLDVRTQAAIPEVELFAMNGALLAKGDAGGLVQLRLPVVPFEGQLRKVGYVASALSFYGNEPGDSVVVMLAPASAQSLSAVEVKANAVVLRFADFDRRRITGGGGLFLTDSQITKGGHMKLTDLFRRFPSIRVVDSSGTFLVTSARAKKPSSLKGGFFDLAPCVFQVLLDDVRMPWGFDMDLLNREEIHGIEIYPGPATIPVEYKSTRPDAMCGMIAIWTKSR